MPVTLIAGIFFHNNFIWCFYFYRLTLPFISAIMKLQPLINKISEKKVIVTIVLVALALAIQCYAASVGREYTRYNNYVIFKQSFEHLLTNKNLYLSYPKEYFDLYKYSPAFTLFMGLFYYLPDIVGLILFNLLNISVFIISLQKLKLRPASYKFLFLFVLTELAISLSMTQTNLLIAGLIILAFSMFEEDKPCLASLCIVLTFYIKIFGIAAFALWFLYPNKGKFLLYSVFWTLFFAVMPVIFVSTNNLLQQYQNWLVLLKNDHDASYGASFLGWMHSWFHLNISKIGTVAVAAVIFCIPLLKIKLYKLYSFRLQILASVLLWIVIFNHRGESPTYIIAMAGVAIWYFSQKPVLSNKILLWLALIFTSFSSTDLITPGWINDRFIEPYSIKAIFCCVIWFKLIYDLITESYKPASKP